MKHLHPCRPQRAAVLFAFALALVAAGCGDDPVRLKVDADLGGFLTDASGAAVSGASVYLAEEQPFFGFTTPFVRDSTRTDQFGRFGFDDLSGTVWRVYGAQWNALGEDFAAVSPFSESFYLGEKSGPQSIPLRLAPMAERGVVTGNAQVSTGYSGGPAADAEIILYRYRGAQMVVEAETTTDENGDYALPAVKTGNYVVDGRLFLPEEGPYPYALFGTTEVFFCDGKSLTAAPPLTLTETMVEKPAVYIYPEREGPHSVRLAMGDRVRLTRSIPEYGEGWEVFVDRRGRIDGRWDYLFYEVAMTGSPLLGRGWCLDREDLAPGLERIVRALGLDDRESRDFLEYWQGRLPGQRFLVVKPLVDGDLDHLVGLSVDPVPDTVRRFWLLFSGSDRRVELEEPRLAPLVRRGGVVIEWGGAVVPAGRGG